ncbi:MAG TPA: hypothetical protein VNZ45_09005 [Bacteroidia bacterium]|jgi:hypothetical protein|nr:hypothetical protein [Bacteroidia bacterium]
MRNNETYKGNAISLALHKERDKRVRLMIPLFFLLFIIHSSLAYSQFGKKPPVLGDTTGLYEVESKIDLFKPIVQAMSSKINACNSLDTIQLYASVMEQIDDTLINHLVPIFNGYSTLHPDQYQPLKDIQDLTNNILDTKKLDKAKKYGLKLPPAYDLLMKAK